MRLIIIIFPPHDQFRESIERVTYEFEGGYRLAPPCICPQALVLGFTEALCSKDADRPGARGSEKLFMVVTVDECEGRSDAVVVVRIEREIGWWCRLWDCGRDRGPKCIAGLRALVRILTYPAYAMNCCLKCDVDRLGEEMTLLAHVIDLQDSLLCNYIIIFILNSLFEDNSSDFDLFLTRIHCLCLLFCQCVITFAGLLIINHCCVS